MSILGAIGRALQLGKVERKVDAELVEKTRLVVATALTSLDDGLDKVLDDYPLVESLIRGEEIIIEHRVRIKKG